ncbi:pumilio homolog 12-like [Andrographis paniculata]|uniref:pumilio homolog 12-like n=1 Tax=Andrographis paniculata TaxID=175694 RepID=UPI0021E8B74B|nr:pumilio homolog 12-like [Andrographis paniculata]
MDRQIQEIGYSTASRPLEYRGGETPQRGFWLDETRRQTPLISSNIQDYDQAIESAFLRMNLSEEYKPHYQTPSFHGLPETLDDVALGESVHRPMACGERQRALGWAHHPRNNGAVNGPFSLFGPHESVPVGPDAVGFPGTGPNIGAGNPLEMLRQAHGTHLACGTYQSPLHGKQPLSRNVRNNFPASLPAQQSKFYVSEPSLMHNNMTHMNFMPQQFTVEQIRGNLYALATDQVWSGALNFKLEQEFSEADTEMILPEVMQNLTELMRNQFGSQFFQNFFAACNENQRTRIMMSLSKAPFKLISICLNPHGGRAIQKLFEKLSPNQILLAASALSFGAVVLATDPNGQHVIQHCLRNFPVQVNEHIFREIANNCYKIATNKSGCCVLQSCIENSTGEAREQLIAEIKENALDLAQDPYGNYVVQHLIGLKMPGVITDLVRRFQGCFASLSCNKYASNVVEKFLQESGENHITEIILELLESPTASVLLTDPYGNFVIQSALSNGQGHVRDTLLNFIQANAPSMQSNLYGKKILAWFEKRRSRTA